MLALFGWEVVAIVVLCKPAWGGVRALSLPLTREVARSPGGYSCGPQNTQGTVEGGSGPFLRGAKDLWI